MENNFFNSLINPLSPVEFYSNYWDKKILFVKRNNPKYYSSILNFSNVNNYLGSNDIFYPRLRLAKKGESIPYQNYTYLPSGEENLIISMEKVMSHFANGATIILQSTKYKFPSISNFTNSIEKLLQLPCHANIYVTPRNSQGFSLHYDPHSVFILQIYGTKKWKLYNSLADKPLPEQFQENTFNTNGRLKPEKIITLNPGDLVYIPRGYGHEAATSGDLSIHITLSLFPVLWIDIIKEAFRLNKSSLMQSPLNLTGLKNSNQELLKIIDSNLEKTDLKTIIDSLNNKIGNSKLLNINYKY